MPNINYKRSRSREYSLKKALERQGYFVIRAAGSKGFADLVAIKPIVDPNAPRRFGKSIYEVRFIQIKVSINFKTTKVVEKTHELPWGEVPVEFWKYKVIKRKNGTNTT